MHLWLSFSIRSTRDTTRVHPRERLGQVLKENSMDSGFSFNTSKISFIITMFKILIKGTNLLKLVDKYLNVFYIEKRF